MDWAKPSGPRRNAGQARGGSTKACADWLWRNIPELFTTQDSACGMADRSEPGWTFNLVDNEDMERTVQGHAPAAAMQAFRSINRAFGAARADFWRYLVLLSLGGVYFDADICLNMPHWTTLLLSLRHACYFPNPMCFHTTGIRPWVACSRTPNTSRFGGTCAERLAWLQRIALKTAARHCRGTAVDCEFYWQWMG